MTPHSREALQLEPPPHTESETPQPGRRRWPLWLLLIVLAVGVAALVRSLRGGETKSAQTAAAKGGDRKPSVRVLHVTPQPFSLVLEGLGTVTPLATVTVRPQVDGPLLSVAYQEGGAIKKGQLLAEIDPRPFRIKLAQARATAQRDQAQLKNAQLDLSRYESLREQKLIAQQQLDAQRSQVDQLTASLAADQANVDDAALQLEYTRILSPIDGVAGIRQVDPGNLVHTSDQNGIVVLTKLDPISVVFTLPQDELPQLSAAMAQAECKVTAVSRAGDQVLAEGVLRVIDNQINTQTASVRLKAQFDNPDKKLWPNQFVRARIEVSRQQNALVLPAAAVQQGPQGSYVYVLTDKDVAQMRPVQLALLQGEQALIGRGLTPGERVVVEGQEQIKPNSPVTPRELGSKGGGRTAQAGAPQGAGTAGRTVNLSEPFVRRPVATTLLTLGVVLAGMLAFRQLPIAALPQVDYPTIVVSTLLPGASADTMASSVTTPLERQFGQVPGLSQMTSVSSQGSSQVTLQFELERSIDSAEQDVQAAINAASNLLPPTLPAPPTYSKSNPADSPILTLALHSDSLPLSEVDAQIDALLAQKISQVPGVGLVTLNGRKRPAVRVQVDPMALAGTSLTIEDVRAAIVAANVNQPAGTLDGPRQQYTLDTNDQLAKARDFEPILLAYKNGSPLRLREVAQVIDGVENDKLAGWAGTERAIILNVQRQPGANVIAVADRVKQLLPDVASALPPGVRLEVLSDRTETVRASVEDVEMTLILTIGLVVLVIFLFLGDLRATFIPAVAVPVSLIATFGVMWAAGFSLNNLSLMALTIATGFVVDDAIVMVENIARYLEAGMRPLEATLKGAKEIGFTIVSLTVSLVAVLIPLLFMGGLIGRIFREFAVTLSAAIALSALISLTLTPMMAAHLLHRTDPHARKNAFLRACDAAFDGMLHVYRVSLARVLRHRAATLFVTLLTALATGALAYAIPKGLFPTQDTGLVQGVTRADSDVSFARMSALQEALCQRLVQDPAVASVASFIGADGTNETTNVGRLSIALKPRAQRHGVSDVLARLSQELNRDSGLEVFLQAAQDLQIDSRVSRTQFQWTLEDPNPQELTEWAPRIIERMRQLPELSDVASDAEDVGPVTRVIIDRDTAARVGVTTQAIDDTLYDAFGQRQVSTIYTQLNLYRVILEVTPALQGDPSALDRLFVRSTAGTAVPLSAVARFAQDSAPLVIGHQGQFRAVTMSFNVRPGVSLGRAVAAIEEARDALQVPPGVHASFQGAALAFTESLKREPALVLAALITVYIVLGVLYESYIHPITILSTLPSAGLGALAALWLCGSDFDVIALIGIVLLIGIVKKNAIMMIDFAIEAERNEGLAPPEAIFQACMLRFRPIMMTTLAALLGGLPLALGTGVGSELRRPLGISVVGGLCVSQLLTLYTTPVIYLALSRLTTRGKRARMANEAELEPAP